MSEGRFLFTFLINDLADVFTSADLPRILRLRKKCCLELTALRYLNPLLTFRIKKVTNEHFLLVFLINNRADVFKFAQFASRVTFWCQVALEFPLADWGPQFSNRLCGLLLFSNRREKQAKISHQMFQIINRQKYSPYTFRYKSLSQSKEKRNDFSLGKVPVWSIFIQFKILKH